MLETTYKPCPAVMGIYRPTTIAAKPTNPSPNCPKANPTGSSQVTAANLLQKQTLVKELISFESHWGWALGVEGCVW